MMLIVDDVEINRVVLRQFFKDEYTIIEASNGKEALSIIDQQPVSIVLVDLVMPVMDGFEVLSRMKSRDDYMNIPVVVMTSANDDSSEAKAMEMGAADFIVKPYNPTIVRCRIKNVMARQENEWRKIEQVAKDKQIVEMHRYIERDQLTGVYNREIFYQKASALMQEDRGTRYAIIYFDISCFKVINDLFHVETGNLILKTAAVYFQSILSDGRGLCGRMEADHFTLCVPSGKFDMNQVIEGLDATIQSLGISHNILFYAGVYPVDNVFLPVDQMCDRAHMAMNRVKGNYQQRYAYYDDSMRDLMLEEQMITRDMEFALQEHQFSIYLQPVCNLHTDRVVSAEALVRWNHPSHGMISSARFVPVFERNGFIVRLDRFVWEEACRFMHDAAEQGLNPVPVSVNVSRVNFYNFDLLQYLLGLIERYELKPDMLRLEVTESAYTDNPHQLMEVVRDLRQHGFKVLMDDFGSGYSSLNMLKDLPVDTLKIDMAFVHEVESSSRANTIMRSIITMAKGLDMSTIVEGVETQAQIDFLDSIGCEEIQGYYFSRPLPEAEFKGLLARNKKGIGVHQA